MNEVAGQVFDYLSYKNKIRTAEWAERLWQQHLNGAPEDIRADEDRQRYFDLLNRVEKSRKLANKLHTRRTAHAPRFAELSATGS